MLKATITLKIDQYRPLGSVFPICATMTMPKTPGITLSGENIIITDSGPAQLTFRILNSKHVLLGIAFAGTGRRSGKTDLGQGEFPTVTITRSLKTGSTLTVLNQDKNDKHYDYLILVQSAADGSIGIIDPGIQYEP